MELSRVYVASGAYRSSSHQADGRTDGTATDPSSPGPTREQNTSTSSYRERKRGSSSAKSSVRDQLLFSRTTTMRICAKILISTVTLWKVAVNQGYRYFHTASCGAGTSQ